jgi:hypothetical protein
MCTISEAITYLMKEAIDETGVSTKAIFDLDVCPFKFV